jgi:hypothetical protein
MSLIIKKFDSIHFSNKKNQYGIKPFRDDGYYGISVPVTFDDKSEIEQFKKEMSKIYSSVKFEHLLNGNLEVKVKIKSLPPLINRVRYEIESDEKALKIKVKFPLGTTSGSFEPKANSLSLIDNSLIETILGRKLKEYWVSEEKISEKEAQERLETITPYAGFF